jgi:hypothetical protein
MHELELESERHRAVVAEGLAAALTEAARLSRIGFRSSSAATSG